MTAHIYRHRDDGAALGVGFDDFLCTLTGDVRAAADVALAGHGWTRVGDWSSDTPHNPLTGLWTAPIEAKETT